MLEDVNNVLNSGDVPNLYGPEEMETIMTTCRRDCLAKRITPTKINIFAQVGVVAHWSGMRGGGHSD
jgi:dynein heavy chain